MSADDDLSERARALVASFAAAGLKIATAESCTGGMVSACLTAVPGSSAVLDRGFVTYSNEAKTEMIGVPATLILRHGAVSQEVARSMAEGALSASRAWAAVAITGVAGPGGGSETKPVGLVHFAVATRSATQHEVRRFGTLSRDEIRRRSVTVALDLLDNALQAAGATAARP